MVNKINIRSGTEAQKEELLNTYPNIANVICEGGYFIIAEINNDIIGYLWAFKRDIPAPIQRSEIFINIIEVIYTNLRCKGIASKMIDEIMTIARKENVYQVRAFCDIDNIPSHHLWLKNKFSISPVKGPDGSIEGLSVTCVL